MATEAHPKVRQLLVKERFLSTFMASSLLPFNKRSCHSLELIQVLDFVWRNQLFNLICTKGSKYLHSCKRQEYLARSLRATDKPTSKSLEDVEVIQKRQNCVFHLLLEIIDNEFAEVYVEIIYYCFPLKIIDHD